MDEIIKLTHNMNFNNNTTQIIKLNKYYEDEQRNQYLIIMNNKYLENTQKLFFKNLIFKNSEILDFSIYCNNKKYTSKNGLLFIGRDNSKCLVDIICPLIYISRIHCIIFKYNNIYHILDSWSYFGTYLSNSNIFNIDNSSIKNNRKLLLSLTANFNLRLSEYQFTDNILKFSDK